MITTSANRVKAAGFWCEDATEQTQRALDSVGADWDTEIPIINGLELLGLQNTILAMGAVRPKWRWYMQKALEGYVEELICKLEHYIGLATATEIKLRKLRRVVFKDMEGTRAAELAYWHKQKFNTSMPEYRLLCEAILILLTDAPIPLHMRAIHAGKSLLSAAKIINPDSELHGELVTFLREQLDNANKLTTKHKPATKADVQGTSLDVEVSGLQDD